MAEIAIIKHQAILAKHVDKDKLSKFVINFIGKDKLPEFINRKQLDVHMIGNLNNLLENEAIINNEINEKFSVELLQKDVTTNTEMAEKVLIKNQTIFEIIAAKNDELFKPGELLEDYQEFVKNKLRRRGSKIFCLKIYKKL